MELLEFWEEISLVPDAVRQIEKLEITEGEYEKLRELFLRDVNLFYEAVKKEKISGWYFYIVSQKWPVRFMIGIVNREFPDGFTGIRFMI